MNDLRKRVRESFIYYARKRKEKITLQWESTFTQFSCAIKVRSANLAVK